MNTPNAARKCTAGHDLIHSTRLARSSPGIHFAAGPDNNDALDEICKYTGGPNMDFFLTEGPLRPSDAVAAIIACDDGRYLMQLRDQKPNLYYPGHWGLFGGAIEPRENPEVALHRELMEEIELKAGTVRYVTEFTFDYGHHGRVFRRFYEVRITSSVFSALVLHEGADMRLFEASEILNLARVVPYDSFAIWLHASGALRT